MKFNGEVFIALRDGIDVKLYGRKKNAANSDDDELSKAAATVVSVFWHKEFTRLTGLLLKDGQCLKIKLTAEVLEGEDGNGN